jgi:HD-GYP domain-containing protein (c-di-GMP phosphodiesterase class II)
MEDTVVPMQKQDLKSTIQRKLLWRLGLVGLAISVILAIGAWVKERDRVSDVVINRARQAVKRYNLQILPILDAPALDRVQLARKLEEFSEGAVHQQEGSFVLAAIYDGNGNKLLTDVDPLFANPGPYLEYMDRADHKRIDIGEGWHQIDRIGGVPFIHVAVPLENSRHQVVAHIEGVFVVSDEEIWAVRRRMLRSAMIGIAIVLVTTVLIYPLITTLLGRLARLTTRLLDANLETLQVLGSAIAKRDSDTDAHNFRVTVYSVKIAEAIGLDTENIRTLIKGAFLHDVGKIGIRDNVLLKPGPLTDDEYEVMKGHVNHGIDIVKRSEWLHDARAVVGSHHEKFDGSGYDRGLRGEEIPVNARIFALADVFDALTSRRPYKEPYTFDESMQVLGAGRGTHFDPFLLDEFSVIVRRLYEEFAHADVEKPRVELGKIVERYFHMGVGELV